MTKLNLASVATELDALKKFIPKEGGIDACLKPALVDFINCVQDSTSNQGEKKKQLDCNYEIKDVKVELIAGETAGKKKAKITGKLDNKTNPLKKIQIDGLVRFYLKVQLGGAPRIRQGETFATNKVELLQSGEFTLETDEVDVDEVLSKIEKAGGGNVLDKGLTAIALGRSLKVVEFEEPPITLLKPDGCERSDSVVLENNLTTHRRCKLHSIGIRDFRFLLGKFSNKEDKWPLVISYAAEVRGEAGTTFDLREILEISAMYESAFFGAPPTVIRLPLERNKVAKDIENKVLDGTGKLTLEVTFELDLWRAFTSKEFNDEYQEKFGGRTMALPNNFEIKVQSRASEEPPTCVLTSTDVFEVRK